MSISYKQKLIADLQQNISSQRAHIIEKTARERTNYLTVVFEDTFQPNNISAALRSCDSFGIRTVHVVEQNYHYALKETIAKGGGKWTDIKKYNTPSTNNTATCFETLKKNGYRILVTTPHEKDTFIDQIPLDKPIALVFGNEQMGISHYAQEHADGFVKIPMYGFAESLNLSASVAICLYDLTRRLRSSDINWRLSPEEIVDLQLDWIGRDTYLTERIRELLLKGE